VTDSELVPWGKGEKQPDEGDEIDPETICLQRAGVHDVARYRDDRVPIEEWANDFMCFACLTPLSGGRQRETEC